VQTIIVAAGILVENGRVLLARRKRGSHLQGKWEFPGGKCEEGEDPKAALVRELSEEVGIEVTVGDPVCITFHRYEEANKSVLLLFYEVTRTRGEPRALDVAAVKWGTESDLDPAEFPPADVEVLGKVRARLSFRLPAR
jgi:8-oxo-dGTP diphosphatase